MSGRLEKGNAMEKKKLVIGVIGADCHAVGNKILEYCFTEAGFEVINIGVLSSQEEFIHAAIETAADAIIVSSLYGHGEIDCRGLRDKCNEAGLQNILLYVGGNIVVGKQDWAEVEARFKAMGFDRVYRPGTLPETDIADLCHDLKLSAAVPQEEDQATAQQPGEAQAALEAPEEGNGGGESGESNPGAALEEGDSGGEPKEENGEGELREVHVGGEPVEGAGPGPGGSV